MKYEVKNRYTGDVQFTAEIDCDVEAPTPMKCRLAAMWAVKNGADLSDADLSGADLSGADLSRANLSRADLSGADLSDAVPQIENIDAKIFAEIEKSSIGGRVGLKMDYWHTCGTTHCRGGWAIHLAGDAGYALEAKIGSCAAAALIYAASRPGKRVPDFFASNDDAFADICACAVEQTEAKP